MTPRKPPGFWDNVVKLARNPLGIIALTIACCYGIAVHGFSTTASGSVERMILLVFAVVFPFVVSGGFYNLIVNHHTKLYGPGDFKDEGTFERLTEGQRKTPPAPPGVPPPVGPPTTTTTEDANRPRPVFVFPPVYGNEPIPGETYGNGPYGMELMILNTLWIHQVNLSPTFEQQWTFRINANSPVFLPFREASSRLIGRSLSTETDQGMICLTHAGFSYCKRYHTTFPKEQFYPETPINPVNLEKALAT